MRKRTWKSTTFWLAVWAAVIITGIVVLDPAGSPTMQSVAGVCSAIILAYVGGNKAVDVRHGPEQEPESKE
jgi:hypothetical protein